MTLTQGTPKTFQTEHALVGGRKLSAFRYHYITCPKRLPRKLKKKMRKLEKEVDKRKSFWPVLITDKQAKSNQKIADKCFESDYERLMSVKEESEIKVGEHLDKIFKETNDKHQRN